MSMSVSTSCSTRNAHASSGLQANVLTAPFVPLLFQGEEWGASSPFLYFTDHADPELAEAVREGRRREFAGFEGEVPDPQAEDTFVRSKLDWEEISKPKHARLLDWHRALVRLRRATPALTDGRLDRLRATADAERGALVIERGDWIVACNLAPAARAIALPATAGARSIALAFEPDARLDGATVALPADGVAILRREVTS